MQSGSPVALPGSCPRRLRRAGRRPAGGEDGVADLAFERAQRFFRGFAFGQFLVV